MEYHTQRIYTAIEVRISAHIEPHQVSVIVYNACERNRVMQRPHVSLASVIRGRVWLMWAKPYLSLFAQYMACNKSKREKQTHLSGVYVEHCTPIHQLKIDLIFEYAFLRDFRRNSSHILFTLHLSTMYSAHLSMRHRARFGEREAKDKIESSRIGVLWHLCYLNNSTRIWISALLYMFRNISGVLVFLG